MISPYKAVLVDEEGRNITIDRDGAMSVTGRLDEVTDYGCIIAAIGPDTESSNFIFIAFENIRGVGRDDHDPKKIGK